MGIGADSLVITARLVASLPMQLAIESMTSADLPEVMEIERLSFSSPWSQGLFLHELKVPFSRVKVMRLANNGRKLVGYVCWWVVGPEVHLLNLAVHPDFRRGGLGHMLLQLVIGDANANRAESVSLEVQRENVGAQSLYRAHGFEECGVRRHYYGRGQDAIIMTRRFTANTATPAG